jgi:secreted PhoX family phosphatase
MSFLAYLTEDDPVGCLYRFTPHDRKKPFLGKLEALRIVGRPALHTEAGLALQAPLKIEWVKVDDPLAKEKPLHEQARDRGAAMFSRAEGIWLDGEGVVFTATTGGQLGRGQLFRLDFAHNSLTLVAEARSESDFNGPDNLTVAPWGDFVVAEDGPGPAHVFVVRTDGSMLPLLRNDASASELAGVCFSPDGKVLFCNLQYDGLTVAIRGPWDSFYKPFA